MFAFIVLDISILYLSYLISFLIRFGDTYVSNWEAAMAVFPYSAILLISLLYILDVYKMKQSKSFIDIVFGLVSSNACLLILSMAVSFWIRAFSTPRSILLGVVVINLILQISLRSLLNVFIKRRTQDKHFLVVSGSQSEATYISEQVHLDRVLRNSLVNVHLLTDSVSALEISGHSDIIVGTAVSSERRWKLIEEGIGNRKQIYIVPTPSDFYTMSGEVSPIGDILTFAFRPSVIPPYFLVIKRLIDIIGSFIFLCTFSWVILTLLAIIPASSAGPAFYSQMRVGLDGRIFRIYKFRSMFRDAEKSTGAVLATAGDPRVTKLGKFMRATRLDELPQLWNVLRGDMSLVGPRPERPEFAKQYIDRIPEYNTRHELKPGVTGFAQVMGNYCMSAEDKLRFDLWYVRNYSPILDLKILVKTIMVIFRPTQARGVETQSTFRTESS